MLFDPTLNERRSNDPEIDGIWKSMEPPVRLEKGIWQLNHWNPDIDFRREQFKNEYPEMNPHSVIMKKRLARRMNKSVVPMPPPFIWDINDDPLYLWHCYKKPMRKITSEYNDEQRNCFLDSYGVCDNAQQLLDMYDFEKDSRLLTIFMVEIRREDESPDGGWRYHKWGEYIGTQKPEHEYLYDDKHIDAVYTYSICEMQEV